VKVLAISNLYPPDVIGGYELACFQAVEALRARGHEVRVLTSTPREPVASAPDVVRTLQLSDVWNTYLCDYRRSAPATLHRLNVESRFVNAHNVHALTALLEEFQPDVAYVCNLIGVGGLGIMGCLQYLKVPWVWQLGDRVPYYMCCKWERVVPELAREFERFVQGHFIVVSNRLLDEIESFGIRLNGQVDVLPYWIAGKRPPARRGFYRAGSCLRIVSAGQIVQNKGMDLIIEAAARLRDGGCESFMVDLYGKVTDPFFPNLIRKHDLAGHVVLKGARPHAELLPLYRHYDLFAFPTWEREPFGLVPLEAGVAGCVSVITQNCGIAEWLVNGVHCLKAPRTAESFAHVFRQVFDGTIELEPLARRVAATVWRDFHLDAFLPRIESALERASRQSRAGAGTRAEAYRLALLAEKLALVLVEEPFCA